MGDRDVKKELAAAIAARPYEKVKRRASRRSRSKYFIVLPNSTVTICSITLDNGFSARGESACVDTRNFD